MPPSVMGSAPLSGLSWSAVGFWSEVGKEALRVLEEIETEPGRTPHFYLYKL